VTPQIPRAAARAHDSRTDWRRRVLLALAVVVPLILIALPLEWARETAADGLFRFVASGAGGFPAIMTVAGWLTLALLPATAVLIDRDYRRRYGTPTPTAHAGTTQLIQRVKTARGHGVARRPWGYWVRRGPLLLVAALAVIYLPVRGTGATAVTAAWRALPGGDAFLVGWRWACGLALLGTVVVVAAPIFAGMRPRRARPASPTGVYAVALAMPVIALIGALVNTA
jgi:hypothetical protein